MLAKMSLCSAEEDADGASLDVEDHDDLHSPTDVSEDSVEVRVSPIVIPVAKSAALSAIKRKHRQQGGRDGRDGTAVVVAAASTAASTAADSKSTVLSPSPKRRRPSSPLSPFRPWSIPTTTPTAHAPAPTPTPTPNAAPNAPVALAATRVAAPQEEPLALVKTRVSTATPTVLVVPRSPRSARHPAAALRAAPAPAPAPAPTPAASRFSVEAIIGDVMATSSSVRPPHPPIPPQEPEERMGGSNCSTGTGSTSRAAAGVATGGGGTGGGGQQRNYKNMTRERRIEANARERTRVHTISAAFDTLRRSVPAYSHSQKLSKLSVLRIACSYILTLSRVAGMDYSEDQSSPAIEECVDQVTRTIQTEGKLRRKRDEHD